MAVVTLCDRCGTRCDGIGSYLKIGRSFVRFGDEEPFRRDLCHGCGELLVNTVNQFLDEAPTPTIPTRKAV